MSRLHAVTRLAARVVSALLVCATTAAAAPPPEIGILDLVEMELGHTSIAEHYAEPIALQRLLDGARTGMIAYLRGRGIADPNVASMHARADGRGAVPAIERQIGLAVQRYGPRVVPRELVYAALRGEVGALHDRYSVLFTAAEVKRFSAFVDGSAFGGVGMVLARDDATQTWSIDTVFPHSPAERAGLRAGDAIASIDGAAMTGVSNERITGLLRGRVGTTVRIAIVRAGVALADPVAVVRATIVPPDVTARLLPRDIGYVALHGFPLDAADQVRTAMRGLASRGARAYVFDLRDNGGGYESASVHVASLFVPSGPVVSMQERRGKRHVTAADGHALPAAPLVVLVNANSASGAELVAAAIHDRGDGLLVGATTFGKGLVQTMFPLPDGAAIKLTTARYFTPAGRFIDRVGLVPDVAVVQPADAVAGEPGHDAQLDAAVALLATPLPAASQHPPDPASVIRP